MEKARSKSTRRKVATLKWVSTKRPVKGTRATMATETQGRKQQQLC